MDVSGMPYPCLNIWEEGSHWDRQEHFHRCMLEIYSAKLNYFPLLNDISNFHLSAIMGSNTTFERQKEK